MNTIDSEVVHINVPGVGHGFTCLPVIPEDAPYRVREGIARQRIAATTGTCPCGARIDYSAASWGDLHLAEAHHDQRCPGHPARLNKAVRRWVR